MPTVRATSRNAGSGDAGAGGWYFVLDAAAQSINQEIEISVVQLEQLSYQSGSGARPCGYTPTMERRRCRTQRAALTSGFPPPPAAMF
jgi:hypothetical protein